MKKNRQIIGYVTLICSAIGNTSVVHADFWQPKSPPKNQLEEYSPPPAESEFVPFGEDIKNSTIKQTRQTRKKADHNPSDLNVASKFYLGGDFGVSFLDPSIANNNYSNITNNDLSLGIVGGFSWNEKIQLEAQYHSLGTAELGINNDNLKVKYQVVSFDVGCSFWQNTNSTAYASIGLAALSTSSSSTIEKENGTGIKLGVGYAFFLSEDWSARIDYHQFSGDAALLSVGLNRFFGRTTENR